MTTTRCLGFILVFLSLLMEAPRFAHAQSQTKIIEKTMARSELEAVVEKGPQRFIATLRVEPHMVRGRFVG